MHVIKARGANRKSAQGDQLSRATGQIQTQQLLDLIDESAPDEGVVDVHEIESKFANGSRRIALVPPEEAAVCAVVEGSADTTRRMSAVDLDAAVAIAIEGTADTTRRMSAVQSNELAALITPVEVSVASEPAPVVVKFHQPVPAEAPMTPPVDVTVPVSEMAWPRHAAEDYAAIDLPVRRGVNVWMIGGLIAFAGAAAGLVAVLLS